ncbi:hypothetical protein C7N43_35115, partial [Sphingobacteriales bacterium UPWRP_1]
CGGLPLLSNSGSYTPAVAGTYYAEARDPLTGCLSATRTPIDLIINPVPAANAGADQGICSGDDAILSASGGTGYQWSNGLGNTASVTANPATTTTYTVTVTDNGCSATDDVTVTVTPLPTLTVGAVNCSADLLTYTINFTATGGSAAASSGTMGATSVSDIPIATSPVTITVTSGVNAACAVSQDVNAPNCNCPPIGAPVGSDVTICAGATIPALSATVGVGLVIDWYATASGGLPLLSNSGSYTPAGAGTYYAEARDPLTGCLSATRTPIDLIINPVPAANAGADQSICSGDDATLTASGGTGYQWSNGLGNTASVTANPATATTYTVTVTDNGCSATDDVTVTVNEPADAGNDNGSSVCDDAADGNTTIDLLTLTSVAGGTFSPVGGAPALAGTTFDGAGLAFGTYTYNYTVSGSGTCPDDVAIIEVTVDDCSTPLCPTITTPLDTALLICDGKDPGLDDLTNYITFNGLSINFAGFAWYSDAALTTPVDSLDYSYSGNNCDEMTTTLYVAMLCTLDPTPIPAGFLNLTIYPPLDTTLLVGTEGLCAPPTLTSACLNYIITEDNVPSVVEPGDSGTAIWTVSYNGSLGIDPCFSEPFEVAYGCPEAPCPIADFTLSADSLCTGDALILTFTGTADTADAYTWSVSDGQVVTGVGPQTLTMNIPGVLEVMLIVSNSACADTSIQTVSVSEVNVELVASPTSIASGETVALDVSATSVLGSNLTYTWTGDASLSCNDCVSATATPLETTIYTVIVTDEFGCLADDAVSVSVFSENTVIIPNAFSPNGDAQNDEFRIFGANVVGFELYIYNRWGELVFQTMNKDEGWNGIYKDKIQEIGTYVFYARVIFEDGTETFYKGNVTLVR